MSCDVPELKMLREMKSSEERIIVSLTSIKKREAALQETISCLVRQDCDFSYEVRLNISHEPYLMDDGFNEQPGWIAELQKVNPKCNLQVRFVRNTGPYRKLIPTLRECFSNRMGCIIVTCDDDTQYSPNWLSTLVVQHNQIGGLVALRGHTIQLQPDRSSLSSYSQWQRNPQKDHFSLANLPTGKDGIVYRPSYFSRDVLDEDAAMKIAPTADDLWFRWHSIAQGVPCFLVSLADRVLDDVPSFQADVSLWEAYNKHGGNDQTVILLEAHFRDRYGIDIATMLRGYVDCLVSTGYDPVKLCELQPECLAAKQVRALTAMVGGTRVHATSARSYELFRLRLRVAAKSPQDLKTIRPRPDRGAISYAMDSVARFEFAYGWMSRVDPNLGKKLISVVMTTFNSCQTVEWAVESVLAQDHPCIEIIIVDDQSSDGTREILLALRERDKRVRLVFLKKNRGTYFAKNVGLLKARGEYVTFQDSDDWSHPARLRLQLWRLVQSGSVATRCNYVRHHAITNQLVKVNGRVESPGFITLMAKREVFERYGFFDCSRRAADDELISRWETIFGGAAIDAFPVPAYVALYSGNSLIADSCTFSNTEGIRFSLGDDRQRYKESYMAWHKQIKESPELIDYYFFPPKRIFIDKAAGLQSFGEEEIDGLDDEAVVLEEQ